MPLELWVILNVAWRKLSVQGEVFGRLCGGDAEAIY
jgi:hypothetical protein